MDSATRGQDHRPRRVGLEQIVAPVAGRGAVAGHQHDGGAALAVALQIELAAADVDQTGEVAARRGGRRAAGVADWAKPEIGTASIRTIRAMTGIRCIAILLLCSQRRQPSGISSDGRALHVLQKPDVRPVRHPRPRHRLPQIVGVGEEARPLEVVPLEKEQDLMRVGGVAEEPPSLGAVGPARGLVLVEDRLPGVVVLRPCGG